MSTAVGKKRGAGAAVDDEADEDDDKVGRCCSCACGEETRREREGDQPGVPTVWFRFYRGGCIKQLE
jgi:hypothetical protein